MQLENEDHGQRRGDQIVLIHVSDLHIGTSLMPSSAEFHRLKSGYNPHDFRLLRPLQLAILDARKRAGMTSDEPLRFVISGDLTQSGLDNDYATAMALVHQRWQWRFGEPPRDRWIGLGWPREHTYTVPGNHDHWRRQKRSTGHTPGLAPDWFRATPWREPIDSGGGTLRLELYGVDSNSGFEDPSHPGQSNLFAGGSLSEDELFDLERRLTEEVPGAQPDRAVVRALVCHHAFSNSGGFFDARPLESTSREQLLKRMVPYNISVALTGHTHSFHVQDWRPDPRAGVLGVVKELRCATSLQGTRATPGLQGFWMHRIVRSSQRGYCEWTAWKYQLGAGSFDVDSRAPVRFVVPAVQTQQGP